jgi:hypothetical protein
MSRRLIASWWGEDIHGQNSEGEGVSQQQNQEE